MSLHLLRLSFFLALSPCIGTSRESYYESMPEEEEAPFYMSSANLLAKREENPSGGKLTNNGNYESKSKFGKVVLEKLTNMERALETVNQTASEAEQLNRLLTLPPNYNKFELPKKSTRMADPINITVAINIRNIRGVHELNEEMTMEVDLISRWTDSEIQRHHRRDPDEERTLDSEFLKQIWWPNFFFSRTVAITRPDLHGSYLVPRPVKLIINPRTGEVEMASRIVLRLYCPMDFRYYPADTQTCLVRLRSYAETTAEINLQWHRNLNGTSKAYFFNRFHPNFDIYMHNVSAVTSLEYSITNKSASYTYLQFSLSTQRKLSFHVMQTYVPSVFLVVITWLSFFIPVELLEARIGICMTILLTLTAMFASIKEYTPQVSYVKAIDTWMLVCIVFVFFALFQFTLLMYLRYVYDKAHGKAIEATMDKVDHPDPEDSSIGSHMQTHLLKRRDRSVEEYLKVEKMLRVVTRTVENYGFFKLSLGFFLFNLVYWIWLIRSSRFDRYSLDLAHNEPDGI